VAPRLIDVRINLDVLSRLDTILFNDQSPSTAAADDDVAEFVIAARSRVEIVSDRRLTIISFAAKRRGD
jgi:hypothetical protein